MHGIATNCSRKNAEVQRKLMKPDAVDSSRCFVGYCISVLLQMHKLAGYSFLSIWPVYNSLAFSKYSHSIAPYISCSPDDVMLEWLMSLLNFATNSRHVEYPVPLPKLKYFMKKIGMRQIKYEERSERQRTRIPSECWQSQHQNRYA